MADALQIRFAFVSELDDVEGKRVRLLALWTGTGYGENFAYDTTGTPCEHVVGQSLADYPTGVQQRFPDDLWLQQANIESYLAIPLFGAAGQALGHLGVMHDGPMDDRLPAEAILRIFAARAGAELQRTGAEQALQQAHDELERRVTERTATLQHTNERLQAEIIGRQRVEQAVRDSEERFSRFMDNLPGVAFIKDADGRHVFVNKWFENIFHLSHNAWYGKTNEDLFPTDVARRFTDNDQLVLTRGSVLETEEETITQDGTKSSWLVHKFPIRGKDDAALLLGGIAIDITERKRWEEALQESEAQLTLIMDNVPVLIAYVDKELRYRFVNRTFERWHGRSATG
ncbi:MAG: PAS domain-containing protein, partial [Pseudomonadales bacterium]